MNPFHSHLKHLLDERLVVSFPKKGRIPAAEGRAYYG